MKKNDLEILIQKAEKRDGKKFIQWLKLRRPNSIRGKIVGSPKYKNKLLSIKSEADFKMAIKLAKRLLSYVQKVPRLVPNPADLKILEGIIRRLRDDAKAFNGEKLDYKLCELEVEFFYCTDEAKAAEIVLSHLEEMDVPYNEHTHRLYELLLTLDKFYLNIDRLKQRKILSLSFRGVNYPPFYAEDNISSLHFGRLTPFASVTPGLVETISNQGTWANDFSEITNFKWDYLILHKKNSIMTYDASGKYQGDIPGGEAKKIFLRLMQKENLKDGLSVKQLVRNDDKIKSTNSFISRINKEVIPNLIVSENRTYKINPNLHLLIVIPRN